MTRASFINLYADIVAEGRKRNFPDMRPSEEAVSRMIDKKRAAKLWAKHRLAFKPLTLEAARKFLTGR